MRKAKAILGACLIAGFLLPATSQAGGKRIYIRVAPPKPKKVHVIKVRRPHRDAIWVAGRWSWNGKKYVWVGGRWISPRKGYIYIPGHWKHTRHGWYYVGGHWKKV